MELFQEAGIFAYGGFAAFIAGLILIARRPRGALSTGVAAAAMVVGLSMVGQGLGQRLVDRAVEAEPDPALKVATLSMGTREAAANQLLGGLMAVVLVGVGAGVGASRRSA